MDGSGTRAGMIESGVKAIDSHWGGFYRGGRYLAYGRTASGRNLFPMIFLARAIERLDTALLATRLRDVDLYIQASGVGFDVGSSRDSGLLRVSRIPAELDVLHADDEALESALNALATLIVDAAADRVVVDDFSPFARFSSIDHFRTAFVRLLDEIEHVVSTVLIAMPEPANDASRRVIDIMASQMAGSIHVHTSRRENHTQRSLSLIPQIGHATHRVDVPWDLTSLVARIGEPALVGSSRTATSGRSAGGKVDREAIEYRNRSEPDVHTGRPNVEETQDLARQYDSDGGDLGDGVTVPELSVFEETSGQVYEDRDSFEEELQLYFEDFESSASPFLLVAMRMEDALERSSPDDFPLVCGLVAESLYREDSMFADPVSERIIIILGDEDDEAAQDLFSRVKDRMRTDVPDRADHLMNCVSAVVVNNGSPFVTADEFLRYVLDEE